MSNFEQENRQFSKDIDWLAFCYVAGELSGKSLSDFELRLENEQVARDAVVQAMQLATEIYESGKEPHGQGVKRARTYETDTKNRDSQWKLMVGLAAAILVCVSVVGWLVAPANDSPVSALPAEDLAIIWADGLQEVELEELERESDLDFSFEDDVDDEDAEGVSDDWMLVAFELEDTDSF